MPAAITSRPAFFVLPPAGERTGGVVFFPIPASAPHRNNAAMHHGSNWSGLLFAGGIVLLLLPLVAAMDLDRRQAEEKPIAPPATLPAPVEGRYFITISRERAGCCAKESQGEAMVRQRRTFLLRKGENRLEWSGFPTGVEAASVRCTSAAGGIAWQEQCYTPGLDSPESVLRGHVGREILINRRQSGGNEPSRLPETINGRLLAVDETTLVVETNNRQLPVQIIPRNQDITEIKPVGLEAAPGGTAKLMCRILAEKSGPAELDLVYRTKGMGWQADYQLVLSEDESVGELGGWAQIINRSGQSFAEAELRLIEENGGGPPREYATHRATLPEGATQRVPLWPAKAGLSVSRILIYDAQADHAPAVKEGLLVRSAKGKGVGVNLPAGAVSVYRNGRDGAPMMLVEQASVGDTESEQPLMIALASVSGVTGQRTSRAVQEQAAGGPTRRVEITLKNPEQQGRRVLVIDRLERDGEQVANASDPVEHQAGLSVRFVVEVPAGGQKTITYTAQ